MKKYLILIFSITIWCWNCKPENKSEIQAENRNESKSEVKIPKFLLNDISLNEIDSLMKIKNDTLYIYNFWATWCSPCKEELPYFVEKQNSKKSSKVKIVFISIDNFATKNTTVAPFIEKAGMKNAFIFSASSPDEITKSFADMEGIPYTVFLKNGKKEVQIGSMSRETLEQKIMNLSK